MLKPSRSFKNSWTLKNKFSFSAILIELSPHNKTLVAITCIFSILKIRLSIWINHLVEYYILHKKNMIRIFYFCTWTYRAIDNFFHLFKSFFFQNTIVLKSSVNSRNVLHMKTMIEVVIMEERKPFLKDFNVGKFLIFKGIYTIPQIYGCWNNRWFK